MNAALAWTALYLALYPVWRVYERCVITDDDCWLFRGSGSRSASGRPQIRIGGNAGRLYYAHRLVWELVNGSLGSRVLMPPKCGDVMCCNPDHNIAGTHAAAIRRAARDGRLSSGERHSIAVRAAKYRSDARVTPLETVEKIRRRLATGEEGGKIAADLGLDPTIVSRIKVGRSHRAAGGFGAVTT